MAVNQAKITDHIRKSKNLRSASTKSLKAADKTETNVGLTLKEKVPNEDITFLRQFDMDSTFGPSQGMTRLERWERAVELGLQPPPQIKQLIDDHPSNSDYEHPLWHYHAILS